MCSQEAEAHVHFKGSVAILLFLLDPLASVNCNPISKRLIVFGPFILDCATAWATRNGAVPQRRTTFEQRVKYFDQLRSDSGVWHSGILEAANSTLGNVLEVLLSCVCQVARKEMEQDFAARNTVNDVLQYVRADLGDVDLHSALQAISHSFQGEQTDHRTVEGQLITRLFHRVRCVLLLLTILEDEQSIQNGVSTSQAAYLAKILVSYCQSQSIRRGGPIEDYYLISWHNFSHLLLGGMALSQECIERKNLSKVSADWYSSFLGDWRA